MLRTAFPTSIGKSRGRGRPARARRGPGGDSEDDTGDEGSDGFGDSLDALLQSDGGEPDQDAAAEEDEDAQQASDPFPSDGAAPVEQHMLRPAVLDM